ncbi:MAG: Asp-tRNA(Asn)/Glu-tRNA(Gln) amidotransferase GatCAB subunit B, partial [Candidatus Omnitrophica bacterium]|nr:Asp-tRNA(Asn)/Glu-tRNA(Gln) amidotransferase GatCAB subunit B [Candidatus Omnitrophota bacterium]
DAGVLTSEKLIADYFENALSYCKKPKQIANWIQTELLGLLKENHCSINECKLTPEFLAKIVSMVEQGTISNNTGKTILREIFSNGQDPEALVKERNLIQISDGDKIEKFIHEVILQYPQAVNDYRSGKTQAIGFLIGQIMKKSNNKANPGMVKKLLLEKLSEKT